MSEIELPGGIKAVRADDPPEPTEEAAAAGHDPALLPPEPTAEAAVEG